MSNFGIEHPLRIFISSRCGGKYTIARKALKKLLLSTCLAEVYAFETEPASSEDTQSAYLEYVDQSNLCIFLIDNKDGVTPPILSEEKRAKDMHLRLIYIFCDEKQKETTQMQQEIRASLSQKYFVVHEFSDIVGKAYDSVMQDLIAVYKNRNSVLIEKDTATEENYPQSFRMESYAFPLDKSLKYLSATKVLTERAFLNDTTKNTSEISSLELLLSKHLKAVICLEKIDNKTIDGICGEVLPLFSNEIGEVIKLRFEAQKYYYETKYDECLEMLQKAINAAIDSQGVPEWIANDIAIDIRCAQGMIDEQKSQYTLDNPGQKYIDDSSEPVYYPYVDRNIDTMQKEILRHYFSELTKSPNTVHIDGYQEMFKSLTSAFCVAEIHGSIVQTEITRERLISIYSMLCNLYDDHRFAVEYMRLLIINRDIKKIDTFIRMHSNLVESFNGQDLNSIIESVNTVFDKTHIIMSKFLVVSRLGYYFDDTSYYKIYKELVDYSKTWVVNDKRIFNCFKYIYDFYRGNTDRADKKDIIDFLCLVFENQLLRFYMDSFQIMGKIDFSTVKKEDQERIMKHFLELIAKEDNNHYDNQFFYSAVISFCKTTDLSVDGLETVLSEKCPVFYNDTYLLEMDAHRGKDLTKYIKKNLDDAHSRNQQQGINGKYIGYAYECLDVIYSIIANCNANINEMMLEQIIKISIETLSSEKQTVGAKQSAVRLLQLIYYHYDREDGWNNILQQLIEGRDVFSTGYEREFFYNESNEMLAFQYDLFLCEFDDVGRDMLIEKLFFTEYSDSHTILETLKAVLAYLECGKDKLQNNDLILPILYYCIAVLNHKEKDIRYTACKCMIELTNHTATNRIALTYLSHIMDIGSYSEKIAIIVRVSRINVDEKSYIDQIINKGKADNNYIVRYYAERESISTE